jgi:hypothetical protein
MYVCTWLVVRVFLLCGKCRTGVGSTFLGLCSGLAIKQAKMQLRRIAGECSTGGGLVGGYDGGRFGGFIY